MLPDWQDIVNYVADPTHAPALMAVGILIPFLFLAVRHATRRF